MENHRRRDTPEREYLDDIATALENSWKRITLGEWIIIVLNLVLLVKTVISP